MKIGAAILGGCAVIVTVAACASRKPPSGENYYVQATQEYSQHFYQPAIADYQKLIDEYPFSPYAEEAELNIGLSYYKMHNYAEATGAFADFLRMHPTSKQVDLASYYLAMSHFDQIGRPDQDQTQTLLALAQFMSIEQRFPESDFAQLAQEQIVICREMLSRHEYLVGNFYFKTANFKAAESRMAELVARYQDTPMAPEGLYDLGQTLEKQGKKYSAAQAFAALKLHFPKTKFAADADRELKRLNQPVDTEEDPLKAVLAESGFSEDEVKQNQVAVHESLTDLAAAGGDSGTYGANGLPILDKPAPKAAASTVGPPPKQPNPGPATLRTIRLSSSDPPLSVIFDLTGPVTYDDNLQSGTDSSTLTVFLKAVTPDAKLARHMVFDKSIFHDCDIVSDADGTKITVNTTRVSRFAIVPLQGPSRLLVTFVPESGSPQTASFEAGPTPN